MWKQIVVCSLLACGVVALEVDKLISMGQWTVERTEACPDSLNYTSYLGLHKKKVNRTHDGFYGELELAHDLDKDVEIYVDSCKKVDGGCKNIMFLEDNDICHFFMQYAERNFKALLRNMGVKNDSCPLRKGSYRPYDFVFDYTELPDQGLVGSFMLTVTITKPGIGKMFCLILHTRFNEVFE